MSRARGISATLRSATVVAGGAVAVHQLRYLVGYGGDASRALHDQGHAYLEALIPVLALLGGLTLVATVLAAIAGTPSRAAQGAPVVRAVVYAGAILAVFGAQETIEGTVVSGHPGGIAAVLSHGGLIALPLAAVFGWAVWAALRGLDALDVQLREFEPTGARTPRPARLPRPDTAPPVVVAIAGAAGPRAPPRA